MCNNSDGITILDATLCKVPLIKSWAQSLLDCIHSDLEHYYVNRKIYKGAETSSHVIHLFCSHVSCLMQVCDIHTNLHFLFHSSFWFVWALVFLCRNWFRDAINDNIQVFLHQLMLNFGQYENMSNSSTRTETLMQNFLTLNWHSLSEQETPGDKYLRFTCDNSTHIR